MPFTVTHIAAVLPVAWVCRWRIPFSALAIGAMVPDVAGFYPKLLDYRTTHSLMGVLTHCTPIGVIGYYLFHALLKQPLADLLPRSTSDRLRVWTERPIDFSVRRVLTVFACVMFAALTHVFWDSFTHAHDWSVELFPRLQDVALQFQGISVRWYSVLQHGSSVALLPPMLLGFAWWIGKQPRNDGVSDRAEMPRSMSWTLIALMLIGLLIYYHVSRQHHPTWLWVSVLRVTVKRCVAVALVMMLTYCTAMHVIWWRDKKREPYLTDDTLQRISR